MPTNQINVKDQTETPTDESLHYRLGYLKAVMGKRNGRRMTASDVIRELVADAYKREQKRESLNSEVTRIMTGQQRTSRKRSEVTK